MADGSRISPERWRRIESLFESALDHPAAERATFLREAALGDLELRSEVEALLAADGLEDTFIETPIPGSNSGIEGTKEYQLPAGSRVGVYQIVRPIASGGMGRVYLADRTDRQFEKRVAVKVIKRGMDTDEVVRRFRVERQTLANLDHPNIARLLDGGVTDDGLPYLVMDYIEGQPLDGYCDQRRSSTHERLKLFRDVCAAVDYAHRNLVVHRDLKPANILVDGEGVPKLLDFGIAKVLDIGAADGSSLLTLEGFRPMTPEYASPEQVRGEPVTTSSDVYSLGVVLYELLTGHRPYRFQTRLPGEMQRVICEQHPEAPSTVIARTVQSSGTGGESAAALTPESVSRTREGHPRKLRRMLAGDLDNIVLTALRKEPERRYPSVRALVEDIDRYLADRPVTARRDSWSYRTTKWVRRQPALAAMIALVVVTLAAGVVGMSWATREAIAQRDSARRERDRADLEAQKANQINGFVQGMLGSVRPEREGMDVTVRQVLDKAAGQIDADLKDQPVVEANVRLTLGQAYQGLGLYEAAESQFRGALAKAESGGASEIDTARILTNWGWFLGKMARYEEAERVVRQGLAIRRAVHGPIHQDVAESLSSLGLILKGLDRYEEAELLYREALDIFYKTAEPDDPDLGGTLNDLATILRRKKDYAGAEALYREALTIVDRKYGRRSYLASFALHNLGRLYHAQSKLDEAEAIYREALEIRREVLGPDHPELGTTLNNLGSLLIAQEKFEAARPIAEDALRIRRGALPAGHPELGNSTYTLGRVLVGTGDFARAEPLIRECIDIWGKADPSDIGSAARSKGLLGECLTGLGRYEEAESLLLFSYQELSVGTTAKEDLARAAARRLVQLYEATGESEKAETYRTAAAPPLAVPPTQVGGR